jgi:hypothetical protein
MDDREILTRSCSHLCCLLSLSQFQNSAKSLGATEYDFNLNVVPYLQSFGRGAVNPRGICNDATCNCATGWTGTVSTVDTSQQCTTQRVQ